MDQIAKALVEVRLPIEVYRVYYMDSLIQVQERTWFKTKKEVDENLVLFVKGIISWCTDAEAKRILKELMDSELLRIEKENTKV